MPRTKFSSVRRAAMVVMALALASISAPSQAQTSGELESIREQRRQAQAEKAAQAQQVNAVEAEVDELTAALAAVQANVTAQENRVADAERSLADAEARLAESEQAVIDKEQEIARLREQLAGRAINSFMSQGDTDSTLLDSDDISQAVRMQTLVHDVTQGEVDVEEQLRAAEEDLVVERALAADATAEAEALRNQMAEELGVLAEARDAQAALTAEAEDRLDHELSELASIQQLDSQLAAKEQAEVDRLAAELAKKRAAEAAAAAPRAPSGGGGGGGGTVGSGDIVSVWGIQVHRSIAGNVESMLSAASAAGIELSGGGYRDPSGQIAVRRNNCGTSNYAIYEMPSSSCRPPTARPGTSMHEQGRAIDFTYGGRIISSRSSPAYQWLAANAASYGFYNLPSEPWHWSTNGR
ncbi:MAG: D-alanyl-D-alanine carboxypeptidase family protein [Acidimicrobiales bacterium]